jgi:hypothetical protein
MKSENCWICVIIGRVLGGGALKKKNPCFTSPFFGGTWFACPFMGGFLAHVFHRWFSISSYGIRVVD